MFEEANAAQRQRYAFADPLAVYIDKLERAAAEIADDAIRLVVAADDAIAE